MGKVDPRSGIFVCCKGVHDTILENSSAKDYSKTSDIVQTLDSLINQEIMEMLDEGAMKKVKYHVPGYGKSSMYKLKSSQQAYSIQALQNGLLEILSREKWEVLYCLNCLILSAFVHELKKLCEICLVGISLRVSLPLIWIRTCSQNFFKTIKGTNSSIEVVKHSSSDISRRYSSNGKDVKGNFNEQ